MVDTRAALGEHGIRLRDEAWQPQNHLPVLQQQPSEEG